jgi:hypothetical protein
MVNTNTPGPCLKRVANTIAAQAICQSGQRTTNLDHKCLPRVMWRVLTSVLDLISIAQKKIIVHLRTLKYFRIGKDWQRDAQGLRFMQVVHRAAYWV